MRTGGLLASMPSVAEWKAVLDALQRRLVKRTLLVGLSTASSTLPSMCVANVVVGFVVVVRLWWWWGWGWEDWGRGRGANISEKKNVGQ